MAKQVTFSNERVVRDFEMALGLEGYNMRGSITTQEGAVKDASMSVIYPNGRTVGVSVTVNNGELYVSPGSNPMPVAKAILPAVETLVAEATDTADGGSDSTDGE